MFNALKPWHIAVLVVVLILLFGAKKLPDAARGLGRSLRILKAETKNLRDEAKADDNNEMDSKAEPQHSRKTIEGDSVSQPARDKTREDV